MRIRTQLIVSAIVAGIVTLAVVVGLIGATRQARQALDDEAQARDVVRHVATMLVLTNEFALFGSERVIAQWRARNAELLVSIDRMLKQHAATEPDLVELKHDVEDLNPLFDRLVELGREPPTDLGRRRREALLERLLLEIQEVVESRHRWAVAIGHEQEQTHKLYTTIVLAAPAALLVLLLSLGVLVSRRVLGPTRRLEAAALGIRNGDLDARCSSDTDDEIGDAARAVDAMALALQQQSEALRHSEHRLRLVTDNVPALICHLDLDGRYTFVNAHYGHALGLDPAAMIGRGVRELRGEQVHAQVAPHMARALNGEETRFEVSEAAGDGQLHHQVIVIPDRDAAGTVRGVYSVSFDVTERREAELRQARSEQLLVDITDHVPALVSYVDRGHRYRFVNSKYGEWFGVDPATMIGQNVVDAMGAEFFDAVHLAGDAALAGERTRLERKGRRNGRDAWFLTELIPDQGADGEIRGFYSLTVDFTEVKEAQQTQARAEHQLRAITDNLPAMIGYIDADERFRFLNPTAARLLGVDPELAIGRGVGELMGRMSDDPRHEPLRVALAGQRVEFEMELRHADETRTIQTVYIPDPQPDGRIDGVFLLGSDITALKKTEQRLVQLARFDSLTNLPNRRQFEDRLKEAIERATREHRAIGLMFLDIDHFKRINDNHGHAIGDAVLIEFAKRLSDSVRSTDMPARLAGDEFVVMLEGLHGEDDAIRVAEKLIAAVRLPFLLAGAEVGVTTSIGIAFAALPRPYSELMELADQALYRAKLAGRDRYTLNSLPVTEPGGESLLAESKASWGR